MRILLPVILAFGVYAQPVQQGKDLGRGPVGVRRLALVIGNDAYTPPANPLHNAVNDARSMKAVLEGNPFRSWRGGSDGLAAMQAGRGTYIAFATAPGKTADDNPKAATASLQAR